MAKEPSFSYLPLVDGKTLALEQSELQTAASRIWNKVANSISYKDNDYAKQYQWVKSKCSSKSF